MNTLEKARQTQLENIQKKTGKSLAELQALITQSGLTKHGEIRQMMIDRFGLGFGDATMLVHFALQTDGQTAAEKADLSTDQVLDGIYSGAKAPLRPIHTILMATIEPFGPFEIVPKKGYVSLRRKRQFAMLGPGTKSRVELGLNMKGVPPTDRLEALPPGGMCQYRVYLTAPAEVDAEVIAWLCQAYEKAG
jgi:hypothetical protein